MGTFCVNNVSIDSIGTIIGDQHITNEFFIEKFGKKTVETITNATGILARDHFSCGSPSEVVAELIREIFKSSPLKLSDMKFLIVVSQLSEFTIPGTSHLVHQKLNLSAQTFCLDINLGCSGYVFGLAQASTLISTIADGFGVVICGDILSKAIDRNDRGTAMLFGDAFSATVVKYDKKSSPIYFALRSDGSGFNDLTIGSNFFTSEPYRDHTLKMNGLGVFQFALSQVPDLIKELGDFCRLPAAKHDHVFFHQPNQIILNHLIRRLNLAKEKAPFDFDQSGNASGASIPLVITRHVNRQNKNSYSGRALLSGFGSGLSLAAASIDMSDVKMHSPIRWSPLNGNTEQQVSLGLKEL